MKHFMLPSFTGIDNGRIQALELTKGKEYALFDNHRVKKSKNEETNKMIDELVKYLN